MSGPVLQLRPEGLYCPAGDFYIDPWRPVARAIVTHAHSDHMRWGMGSYLCSEKTLPLLRARLGDEPSATALPYGESLGIGGASVSLHPAGHIVGSAQVRVEVRGEVWVVSGDYKCEPDQTCEPWGPVKCHGFVTETTFGLPIYQWPRQEDVFGQINRWWQENAAAGRTSLLSGYSLGKAQRLLAGVDPGIGPIYVHGAVANMNRACAAAGVALPEWLPVAEAEKGKEWSGALVVAPPSAVGTPWTRKFGDVSTAFASGWMAIRGVRRRRSVDQGFVLSDHVDWGSLLAAIRETGAETVWTTHGYAHQVARYLCETGRDARPLETQFGEEEEDAE
ncbi:MAG: ligase-associated DNA damage response exonuclease [Fimbriimonadaceae bacterium]|nr:ligase-associated DNA damage response exonuclease [Fimbriimonadaceae bacterium]QYK55586.1 MAG: ligase-associated DNA damage response exonuclease [Fimbriimonadaceae bacterium]